MQRGFLAPSVLIFAGMSCFVLRPEARLTPRYAQEPATVPEPYVQVTSVTVEPTTIHKTQSPNTTTVVAQILLRGSAPTNPQAIVEVGTSSADPPNNHLKYENPTRTVSLERGVTVVRFKAESTPDTVRGKLKVAVTLGGATKGINVKDSEPKGYIAELSILDP